jgi:hypothetical protein
MWTPLYVFQMIVSGVVLFLPIAIVILLIYRFKRGRSQG